LERRCERDARLAVGFEVEWGRRGAFRLADRLRERLVERRRWLSPCLASLGDRLFVQLRRCSAQLRHGGAQLGRLLGLEKRRCALDLDVDRVLRRNLGLGAALLLDERHGALVLGPQARGDRVLQAERVADEVAHLRLVVRQRLRLLGERLAHDEREPEIRQIVLLDRVEPSPGEVDEALRGVDVQGVEHHRHLAELAVHVAQEDPHAQAWELCLEVRRLRRVQVHQLESLVAAQVAFELLLGGADWKYDQSKSLA
jgi:hypothetical protein